MLLNFLDQPYTRRLFLMIVPYLVFLSAVFGFGFNNYGYYPAFNDSENYGIVNRESYNFIFYEEERSKYPGTDTYDRHIKHFSIPSNKISVPIGEVFVKAQDGDKWLIEKIDSSLTPFQEEGLYHSFFSAFIEGANSPWQEDQNLQMETLKKKYYYTPQWQQKRDSLILVFKQKNQSEFRQNLQKSKAILEKAILLRINNKPVSHESISCDYYMHPHGNSKGLLCFFPMDSLQIGRHHLTVGKVIGKKDIEDQQIYLDTTFHTIPFIYVGD